MTDHTQAALHHLGVADRTPSVDNATSEAATGIGHALLAIADAIRGLTPNTAQDATGCPQNDSQPEPGPVDGGRGAEATGGDFPCCAPNVPFREGGRVLTAEDYTALVVRAEGAEAERDAILADLRAALWRWRQNDTHPLPVGIAQIINRHTPKD